MGGKTVWVGGLPHPATPEEIEEHFGQFGRVVHIEWPMRWDKKLNVDRHKGFCKLTFAERSACQTACLKREFCMAKYPDKEMLVELMKEPIVRQKKERKSGLSRQSTDNTANYSPKSAPRKKSLADVFDERASLSDVRQSSSRFFPRGRTSKESFKAAAAGNKAERSSSSPINTSSRWNWASKA